MACIQTKVIHLRIETKQKYDSDTITVAVMITVNCLPKTLTSESDYH